MAQQKTAIITGSSRGIGRAVAQSLFQSGCNVVINYRKNREQAEALAIQLNRMDVPRRAIAVQADVSDRNDVESLFAAAREAFGTVDILVNNAGIAQQKLFTDLTEDDWRTMVGVHLDGVFYCSQQALKEMLPRHSGTILNISSMWGQVGGSCEVHYSAVKAAVIGMTKALAKEVGPSGITVNCICPGVIETDMNSALTQSTRKELAEETPLGVIGTPEDVAAAAVFLTGDGAKFITGQVLGVNGGLVI